MSKALTSKDLHGALVFQGVITLLFGLAAVFWPHETIAVLVYLFGAYILVSGIVRVVRGIGSVSDNSWWVLQTLLGIVELGFGVYILRHPALTFATFIALIGFVLIIRGVVEIVAAFFEEGDGTTMAMTVLSGLIAVVVGIVVLYAKESAGIAFVWLLGLYAIVVGVLELVAARSVNASAKK